METAPTTVLVAVQAPPTDAFVVAQQGVDVTVDLDPFAGLLGSAVGAFLSTLLVGLLLFSFVPGYARRTAESVRSKPVNSFFWGLFVLLALLVVTVLLVITIVGILVAIPLLLVAWVLWAVGSAVAFYVVGETLVGDDEGWQRPLLVGAAINGLLALTGIGGLVSFGVGAVGFGTVVSDALGD